jgi:hypothetical protein
MFLRVLTPDERQSRETGVKYKTLPGKRTSDYSLKQLCPPNVKGSPERSRRPQYCREYAR